MRPHGLANRPGKPYPATLRTQWTRRESNPHCQHARLASSRWTTGPFSSVRGVGVEPTLMVALMVSLIAFSPYHSGFQGRRIAAFLPPELSGPPGIRTDLRLATTASSFWTSSPCQRSGRGSNPVFRAYQGGVRPQHLQTFKLRRPDLNRRRTAYETVLASRLQSTPQYPRQDSNLRHSV